MSSDKKAIPTSGVEGDPPSSDEVATMLGQGFTRSEDDQFSPEFRERKNDK